MEFRRSTPADYPLMVKLADANYIENLTPEQRKDGFLSIRFTAGDFARVASEVGIVVAAENEIIAGFLCAEHIDKPSMPPVLAATATVFRGSEFHGKPGREWTAFLAGPLCIATEYRGKGLRRGLHKALLGMVRGKYNVGVLFIAFDNQRSYHGATAHHGLEEVGRFELNGRHYHVLAFGVDD